MSMKGISTFVFITTMHLLCMRCCFVNAKPS